MLDGSFCSCGVLSNTCNAQLRCEGLQRSNLCEGLQRCQPQVSHSAEEQAKAIGQAKQLIQAGLVAYTRNGCAGETYNISAAFASAASCIPTLRGTA